MEFKNLFKKLSQNDENCQYLIVPVGFDVGFIERIKNIFKLAPQGTRSYRIGTPDSVDNVAVLLINHDNPLSLHKKQALLNTTCPDALIVVISQGPLANPPEHHIRGMLTASRLLGVLDKLPLQKTPAPKPNSVVTLAQPVQAQPVTSPFAPELLKTVTPHYNPNSIPNGITSLPQATPLQQETLPVVPELLNTDSVTPHNPNSIPNGVISLPQATPLQQETPPVVPELLKADIAAPSYPPNSITSLYQSTPSQQETLPSAPESAKADTVSITPTADKPGYRALIVDDSIAIQMSIKLKLASIEQITTIDFADNGEIALDKTAATQYDLIFLDVMMPGIDGYETCTRLRKRPEYKKTPIIMVSGKTSPLDEVKGVMAGCTTYLTKPVEDQAFHKLSLRVLNWLADRKTVATT